MDYECWKTNAVYESIEDQGRYYGLFPVLSHRMTVFVPVMNFFGDFVRFYSLQ